MGPRLTKVTAEQPSLFDLPGTDRTTLPDRPSPGKNRETWAWTVTAGVTVIDAEALRQAVERAEAGAVTIDFVADPTVEEEAEEEATTNPFDMLAWIIWPTDGLEELLEAEAFRLGRVETDVSAGSDDVCTVSWTVEVRLTDVAEMRRIATQAHPDKAALIRGSLAAAWQHSADPFAPLRSIPGIAWQPEEVVVRHVPRRAQRGSGGNPAS